MKQKKNGFFITILLLLISLAFIVTVSVVFNNIKTNLEREIISSLSEEAEENAALIEKEIDAKFGVLQSFANELSSTGDEIAEIRDMQSFVEVYNFRRMGFVDLNGIAKTTDGFEKDLSFREFYQVGLKGESFITESLQETIGDSTEDMINILSVPVYDNKGEIKGVLFANRAGSSVSRLMFTLSSPASSRAGSCCFNRTALVVMVTFRMPGMAFSPLTSCSTPLRTSGSPPVTRTVSTPHRANRAARRRNSS